MKQNLPLPYCQATMMEDGFMSKYKASYINYR
jgi:hypothetical protein